VLQVNVSTCNQTSDRVKGQNIVLFMQLCVRNSSTVNHCVIVSPCIVRFVNWCSKISKVLAMVNMLFKIGSTC
jgi:hypothetical protein